MRSGIVRASAVAVTAGIVGACGSIAGVDLSPSGAGLSAPVLPSVSYGYSEASRPLPLHFVIATNGTVVGIDNTPASNPTTNAGATLGRVLFHDPRLSVNDRISCASCHQQAFGFSDTARFSVGFAGGRTTRHTMALANGRFYQNGRFFWDERAATLEAQVLEPIQNPAEMGMTLDALVAKLGGTGYYPALFQSAFGTPEITTERVARALAQFVRSLVSAESRFDSMFAGTSEPDLARLSAEEREGNQLFTSAGCARCHRTNAHVGDHARNTGLDAVVIDAGVGNGAFKAPSLRNVAVRSPYMHDGRFKTLDDVVAFYDSGVKPNPNLDPRLRAPDGTPLRLGLTVAQRAAIVAYLGTLTDSAFLTAARFANPFSGTGHDRR